MTPEQETRLNQLIQIIRESAEQIIDRGMTERDLLTFLYGKSINIYIHEIVCNCEEDNNTIQTNPLVIKINNLYL